MKHWTLSGKDVGVVGCDDDETNGDDDDDSGGQFSQLVFKSIVTFVQTR